MNAQFAVKTIYNTTTAKEYSYGRKSNQDAFSWKASD